MCSAPEPEEIGGKNTELLNEILKADPNFVRFVEWVPPFDCERKGKAVDTIETGPVETVGLYRFCEHFMLLVLTRADGKKLKIAFHHEGDILKARLDS